MLSCLVAMCCWLWAWALLCLMGTGLADSGVTQTPRHLIKQRGQGVTLSCSPIAGHLYVYWYQQARGQGLQFLFRYYREQQQDKGKVSDRFLGQQFSDLRSLLNVSALELEDTATYFCASSKDTAWQSPHQHVHKPPA